MKLAVISDVHGNYKALEGFLKYIEEHPDFDERAAYFYRWTVSSVLEIM